MACSLLSILLLDFPLSLLFMLAHSPLKHCSALSCTAICPVSLICFQRHFIDSDLNICNYSPSNSRPNYLLIKFYGGIKITGSVSYNFLYLHFSPSKRYQTIFTQLLLAQLQLSMGSQRLPAAALVLPSVRSLSPGISIVWAFKACGKLICSTNSL